MDVQWKLSIKDLQNKDSSLVRTLPVVLAIQRSIQNDLQNKDTPLVTTLKVTVHGPSGVYNTEVPLYYANHVGVFDAFAA